MSFGSSLGVFRLFQTKTPASIFHLSFPRFFLVGCVSSPPPRLAGWPQVLLATLSPVFCFLCFPPFLSFCASVLGVVFFASFHHAALNLMADLFFVAFLSSFCSSLVFCSLLLFPLFFSFRPNVASSHYWVPFYLSPLVCSL